ncbi:MAG: killer suppression protein [Microcystaceae cyanobacterium]
MEITFNNQKLQNICEQPLLAQKKLGKVGAKKLQSRLADIIAAETVRDLVTGDPHPLRGNRAGEFSVKLDGGNRLVFKPANSPIPFAQDGSIDWFKVTRICVVFIGDYHD